MKKIIWKKVMGFEETHRVSSEGEIVKIQKLANGDEKTTVLKPLISERKNSKPTVNVCLNGVNGKKRFASIGRIVAENFLPNPNKYLYVKHKDGNNENNNVENLEWSKNYVSSLHTKIEVLGHVYSSMVEASNKTGISKYKIFRGCNQALNKDFKYLDESRKNRETGIVKDLPKEEWKYIEGTSKQFMISSEGRIKSCMRTTSQGKVIYSEKLVKQVILEGKARVNIRIYSKKKTIRKYLTVVNEVYKAFVSKDIPPRNLKNIDGNLQNCRLNNIGIG